MRRATCAGRSGGLADWLSAAPAVYSHLPIGRSGSAESLDAVGLLNSLPQNVRLLGCKRSWDGTALILRLQETSGVASEVTLPVNLGREAQALEFKPYEIMTLRMDRSGFC